MNARTDHYRREAGWLERLAKSISLRSDKEALLAEAQSLRQCADKLEAQSDGSLEIGQVQISSGAGD